MAERTCTGPGPKGKPCREPAKARGFCSAHWSQDAKGQPLRPLRERRSSRLVPFTLRVEPATKEWGQAHAEEARKALDRAAAPRAK